MEPRDTIFGFRVNAAERRMIKALADGFQRTESDAVRIIVREAARLLQDSADGQTEAVSSCQK